MNCPHCGDERLTILQSGKYWCYGCNEECDDPNQTAAKPLDDGQIRYFIFNHQNKAAAYIRALNHKYVQSPKAVSQHRLYFIFTDHAVSGRANKLQRLLEKHTACVFIYPHAARVNLSADIYQPFEHTTAHFVPTDGHKEILQSFGYPHPIHTVGWHLCPIKPFNSTAGRRVMFAPIHPRCAPHDQKANRETFARLLPLAKDGQIKLVVRYIRSLDESGLPHNICEHHPNVQYVQGELQPQDTLQAIQAADVVVAYQTVLWLAVAMGVPAVGFACDLPAHMIPGTRVLWARTWHAYAHLLRYPFDIADSNHTIEIIQQAATGSPAVAEWKARLIGQPFDGQKLVQTVGRYI